jgi:hypothetical protein
MKLYQTICRIAWADACGNRNRETNAPMADRERGGLFHTLPLGLTKEDGATSLNGTKSGGTKSGARDVDLSAEKGRASSTGAGTSGIGGQRTNHR